MYIISICRPMFADCSMYDISTFSVIAACTLFGVAVTAYVVASIKH